MQFLTIFLYISLPLVTVIHEVYGSEDCEDVALTKYFSALVSDCIKTEAAKESLEKFNKGKTDAANIAGILCGIAESNKSYYRKKSKAISIATNTLQSEITACGTTILWNQWYEQYDTTSGFVTRLLNAVSG